MVKYSIISTLLLAAGTPGQAAGIPLRSFFGLVNLWFVRDLDNAGQYTTAIYLRRSGQPGAAPWINSCTP